MIELLTVMGIMALLLGISAIGYVGMRRGGEFRGASMSVRTTLALARQMAVTKRQTVSVLFYGGEYTNNSMSVLVGTGIATTIVNNVTYLPKGVFFTSLPSPNPIVFTPSGSGSGASTAQITIREKSSVGQNPQQKTVKVWLLTGLAEEE